LVLLSMRMDMATSSRQFHRATRPPPQRNCGGDQWRKHRDRHRDNGPEEDGGPLAPLKIRCIGQQTIGEFAARCIGAPRCSDHGDDDVEVESDLVSNDRLKTPSDRDQHSSDAERITTECEGWYQRHMHIDFGTPTRFASRTDLPLSGGGDGACGSPDATIVVTCPSPPSRSSARHHQDHPPTSR
jgi:hypothetical protein